MLRNVAKRNYREIVNIVIKYKHPVIFPYRQTNTTDHRTIFLTTHHLLYEQISLRELRLLAHHVDSFTFGLFDNVLPKNRTTLESEVLTVFRSSKLFTRKSLEQGTRPIKKVEFGFYEQSTDCSHLQYPLENEESAGLEEERKDSKVNDVYLMDFERWEKEGPESYADVESELMTS